MSKIILIAALSENRVIGKDNGGLPWHIPEDLEHYTSTVSGGTVIYGRVTFEGAGKNGENTIVLSTNDDWSNEDDNVYHASNTREALEIAEELKPENIYIGGGQRVYEEYLDIADEMVLSHIHGEYEGTVYFPEFSEEKWDIVDEEPRDDFTIKRYERER